MVWEGVPEPVQVVWREAPLPVEEIGWIRPRRCCRQLYARFDPRHYRLDVRQAPLCASSIAHDADKKRWLMMQLLHHSDGGSYDLEVMQAEMQAHLLGRQA